jgi:hypothetical protein
MVLLFSDPRDRLYFAGRCVAILVVEPWVMEPAPFSRAREDSTFAA